MCALGSFKRNAQNLEVVENKVKIGISPHFIDKS